MRLVLSTSQLTRQTNYVTENGIIGTFISFVISLLFDPDQKNLYF